MFYVIMTSELKNETIKKRMTNCDSSLSVWPRVKEYSPFKPIEFHKCYYELGSLCR